MKNLRNFLYKRIPFIQRKTIIKVLFTYFFIIFIFTFLIMSPLSWEKPAEHSWKFLDSFFIATSAFTTTGFSVRNIGVDMTQFGQILIFFLIIFGGLGLLFFKLMLFKILFYLFKINSKTKVFDEQMFERGYSSQTKTKRMMIVSFSILFIIQTIGFFMFFFYFYFVKIEAFDEKGFSKFIMQGNFGKSTWNAAFYSISATNNAGFDLLPDEGSLEIFANEYFIQFLFVILFIIGGIGFPVFLATWEFIVRLKKRYFDKQFVPNPTKFLIKFLLFSYFIVLILSLCSIFISESFTSKNKESEFFMVILFNTLSTRSAGFSTVNINEQFNIVSKFLFSLYMWIGSNPLSTGGGIKATAFIILLISIYGMRDKNNNLIIKRRSVSSSVVNNTFKTFFLSIFFIFGAIVVISISLYSNIKHLGINQTGNIHFLDIFFFTTSSFGNVGLNTIDISDKPNWIGFKLASIFLMIIGQIGLVNFVQYKADRISTNTIYIPFDIPL